VRFYGKLKKGFVLSKPVKQDHFSEDDIYKLENAGKLIITRKRDGWKLFISTDKNGFVRIYTDGMHEVDDRLLHLKKEAALLNMPPYSLLVGEALIDTNDSDDITKVISVFMSKQDRALALQEQYGKIKFMIFNILFWDGKLFKNPYHFSVSTLAPLLENKHLKHIMCVPIVNTSFDAAKQLVEENGWEGLVLYDKDFVISFRDDGKSPKRQEGCYKWKPVLEDDFIVRGWIIHSKTGKFKDVMLLQIDPETGNEFNCGKLGSFTTYMKIYLTSEARFPLVMQIEFDIRFEKSGKLRNARFVRIRADKKIEDCIAPQCYGPKK